MAYRRRSYSRRSRRVPRSLRLSRGSYTAPRSYVRYLNRRSFPRTYRSFNRYSRGRVGNPLRRGNVAQANRSSDPLTPTQKFMFAQLDPFDTKSSGAKIPDSNMMPSITNSDTDIIPVGTSATATDLMAVAFRPSYAGAVVVAAAGTSVSWGATFATRVSNRSKTTPYSSQIELTRPTAHAIRLTSPVAPTSATGFVHLGISTETFYNQTTWALPATVAAMANLQFYKRVTLASLTQSPLTMINKWIDDTAFRYSSPASLAASADNNEFQTDLGWGILVVMVEGCPINSTVLSIEHLLLSEGIPQRDGVFIGSQAAPNAPAAVAATTSAIAETEPFHTEAQQDSYINQGLTAMANGARAAGETCFNNLAVPLLERVGYAAGMTAVTVAAQRIGGTGGIQGVNSNPARIAI